MNAEGQPITDKHSDEKQLPRLDKFFRGLTKADGSDLHLKSGKVPYLRLKSSMKPTKMDPLSSDEIEEMCLELMSDKQKDYFKANGAVDLAYEVAGGDRYRVNVFRQRGNVSMAARRVTRDIKDCRELNLPPVVEKIADQHQGLVLLAGATGSGKSTTIASMLEYINLTRYTHIVTIEDPIEYLYEDKKALINQREIGIDVPNFGMGLKFLMREDPDVVLIGEMRDDETFQAALQAAETGHLVFGTVHASSAPQTVGRILDLFPPEARGRARQSLSDNIRAIICQKLLPSIKEGVGRVPAVEIMRRNPTVTRLIAEERESDLPSVIRSNEQDGMMTFNKCLHDLIEREMIDPKIAYEASPNVDELKMMLKGISTSRGGLVGR